MMQSLGLHHGRRQAHQTSFYKGSRIRKKSSGGAFNITMGFDVAIAI
jgi:hypothetical protein